MTPLGELPELGVGIVYWPELVDSLELARQQLDVVEIEPQAFWLPAASSESGYVLDRRAFSHLRGLPQPKIVHGAGFPIGGSVPASKPQIDAFVRSVRELDGVWASEHLSFNRVRDGAQIRDLGFLLPPLQNAAGLEVYGANIGAMRAALPVPFAVETGVNYLRTQPGELADGEFFASVARTADCGLLLDVHNLWTNERNGRQPVLEAVAQLPLDRVIELHVAGGQEFDGYWVDAHSGLVPGEVLDLTRQIVPRLPALKAIIYEVMPEYVAEFGITASELEAQLAALHELWQTRGRDVPHRMPNHAREQVPCVRPPSDASMMDLVSPEQWERAVAEALGGSTGGRPAGDESPAVDLSDDPGIHVFQRLIRGVRAGKVASTLTMTTRLLLISLGEDGMDQLFEEFWAAEPTRPAASEEAASFARFLGRHPVCLQIEALVDVVEFELAAHRAVLTGEDQRLSLSIDPRRLIESLRQGKLPPTPAGSFDITVTPPAQPRVG
ncbi:DUF692 domain-containing protein [Kribbella sp. NPDC004138]